MGKNIKTTRTTKNDAKERTRSLVYSRVSIARIIYLCVKKILFFKNDHEKSFLNRTFLVDPVEWRQNQHIFKSSLINFSKSARVTSKQCPSVTFMSLFCWIKLFRVIHLVDKKILKHFHSTHLPVQSEHISQILLLLLEVLKSYCLKR